MNKGKVLGSVVLGAFVVGGLYLVNRYWIAPAASRSAMAEGGAHPMAPAFALTDLSGQKLSLSDYKGKVVLLDFWATWCGPCRIEIPSFVELQNRYRDQGFSVVGISADDSPDPVRAFYKEYRMNYPVAMEDKVVGQLYGGILGLPTTFLIGRDGRVYAKHVGETDASVFEDEIKELLAAPPNAEVTDFKPGGRRVSDKIELGDPKEIQSEVSGVDLSKLTAEQKEQFKKQVEAQPCTCGCKISVLKCRHDDPSCATSRKLAREQFEKFTKFMKTAL